MTPHQIKLVQDTFVSVAAISDAAAELFYGKLFELDPSLKPLFKGDMKEQGKKLMKMIGIAVGKLKDLENLVPALEDLAKRHVDYQVKPEHYATVGDALLWTLGQGLGEAFTDEVKEAWATTYTLMSSTMIAAAYKSA